MCNKEGDLFFSYIMGYILKYMKAVFTEKKLLIILIIDLVLTLATPFIIHVICFSMGITNFAYPLFFAIFAVINGVLAYLVGDIILISYKSKNDIVTSPVPDDIILKARHWRYPFIICALTDLVVFGVFCIIFSTTGHWPLLQLFIK